MERKEPKYWYHKNSYKNKLLSARSLFLFLFLNYIYRVSSSNLFSCLLYTRGRITNDVFQFKSHLHRNYAIVRTLRGRTILTSILRLQFFLSTWKSRLISHNLKLLPQYMSSGLLDPKSPYTSIGFDLTRRPWYYEINEVSYSMV